jgi:hypothetical protein
VGFTSIFSACWANADEKNVHAKTERTMNRTRRLRVARSGRCTGSGYHRAVMAPKCCEIMLSSGHLACRHCHESLSQVNPRLSTSSFICGLQRIASLDVRICPHGVQSYTLTPCNEIPHGQGSRTSIIAWAEGVALVKPLASSPVSIWQVIDLGVQVAGNTPTTLR